MLKRSYASFGSMANYDKLVIEVWTDGSLKPYEALSLAAKVITGHLLSINRKYCLWE